MKFFAAVLLVAFFAVVMAAEKETNKAQTETKAKRGVFGEYGGYAAYPYAYSPYTYPYGYGLSHAYAAPYSYSGYPYSYSAYPYSYSGYPSYYSSPYVHH